MRIFLVVLFVLLISDTITKPRGMRRCCRAMHCRCGEPKPTTLDGIREQLDNNKRKIEASLHQSPIIITKNNCLVWSAQFVANNKSPCLPVANYAIECCRLYIKRKVHIGITAKQLFFVQFINEGDHKFLLFSAVLMAQKVEAHLRL